VNGETHERRPEVGRRHVAASTTLGVSSVEHHPRGGAARLI
jgi:hypothetical protein